VTPICKEKGREFCLKVAWTAADAPTSVILSANSSREISKWAKAIEAYVAD